MSQGDQFPCDQHEREMETIRAVAEASRRDLAVMQEILRRLDKAIFGNGTPGLIDRIEKLDEAKIDSKEYEILEKKVEVHERYFLIGLGIMLAMQFLSGNGIISLKGLIGH